MDKILVIQESTSQPQKPVEVIERDFLPEKEGKKVLIKFKTMKQVLKDYPDYFFDKHGNLCIRENSEEIEYIEHLAPVYFCYLGKSLHLPEGCGFDFGKDWLIKERVRENNENSKN